MWLFLLSAVTTGGAVRHSHCVPRMIAVNLQYKLDMIYENVWCDMIRQDMSVAIAFISNPYWGAVSHSHCDPCSQ